MKTILTALVLIATVFVASAPAEAARRNVQPRAVETCWVPLFLGVGY